MYRYPTAWAYLAWAAALALAAVAACVLSHLIF